MSLNKKISFFEIGKTITDIQEININELEFEEELKQEYNMSKFKDELIKYLDS